MARAVRKRKPVEPPKSALAVLMEKHLEDLRLKNYSEYTIKGRRVHIGFFLDWAHETRDHGARGSDAHDSRALSEARVRLSQVER